MFAIDGYGIDVKALSAHSGEDEVLLLPGTQFSVVGAEHNLADVTQAKCYRAATGKPERVPGGDIAATAGGCRSLS